MKTQTIYTMDTIEAYSAALDRGEVCQVDEDLFYWYLEVLPPVYMGRDRFVEIDGVKFVKHCSFGFAEGRDFITDFWVNKDGSHITARFAKKSKQMNPWG